MTPDTLTPDSLTPEAQTAEHIAEARRQGAAHVDDRPNENTTSRAKLYRLFWRWHFYAGMIVAPIILMAAVTGGIYVFIDELQPIMYPTLFRAESAVGSAPNLSLTELSAAALKAYPEAKVVAVTPAEADDLNAVVALKLKEGNRTAMVDPRTGRVAGLYDGGSSFFGIVLGLHRRLLLGTPGRITVELAASWGIILLITGTYLWWPRKSGRASSPGAGVWYPRLRAPLTVVLRDLHTVAGFYAVATGAIVLFTGLFFTQFFGNGYKMLQNGLGGVPPTFAKGPASTLVKDTKPISFDDAVRIAEPLLPGAGPVRAGAPEGPTGSYRIARAGNSSPTWRTTVTVDQYSGAVLDTVGWDDLPIHQKIRVSIYPIHVGSIYGTTTKILALLTCIVFVLLAITGVWMWWRRRPKGTWGLAPSNAGISVPYWLLGTIVGLGILMPAMGMSLAIVLIGDFALMQILARRYKSVG